MKEETPHDITMQAFCRFQPHPYGKNNIGQASHSNTPHSVYDKCPTLNHY